MKNVCFSVTKGKIPFLAGNQNPVAQPVGSHFTYYVVLNTTNSLPFRALA